MKHKYWRIPRMWDGETVVIAGSGESLSAEQLQSVRGKARVIVINDGYLLAPWADLHYFCDHKWFEWSRKYEHPAQHLFGKARATSLFWGFQGIRAALENAAAAHEYDPTIRLIRNDSRPENHKDGHVHKEGLCVTPNGVRTGGNSGHQAINLAFHTGAGKILLIGFDQHGTHWFGDHPTPSNPDYSSLEKRYETLCAALKTQGVPIRNCTPGSKLNAFTRGDLADCLQSSERALRRAR
jgi:hypothetical protein